MLGIGQYLWRLVPGNPILLRVIAAAGKRRRDLFIRCAYLGLLVFLVVVMLLESAGSLAGADLTELTKRSGRIFYWMSYLQLALVALLAPVFTAGAITQEKDSQTYDILLSTPLTNGQIVLGSLLSRLFFVIALLVSGIPIFSITQIFGGVAIKSIAESFMIAAATAFATGAMAMAIATFKVGTRRTIFSFYLFILIYLAIPWAIEQMGYLRVAGGKPGTHISWLTGINPFLALRVIFNDGVFVPPEPGQTSILGHAGWVQWYLSSPAAFYTTAMFTLSVVLVLPSIVMMRRLAQSTTTLRGWVLQRLHLSTGDKTRTPRRVWSNPIAWREAKTKASAARAFVVRYSFMIGGVLAAVLLLWMYASRDAAPVVIASEGYDPGTGMVTLIDHGNIRRFRIEMGPGGSSVMLQGNSAGVEQLRPGLVVDYKAKGGKSGGIIDTIDIVRPRSKISEDATRKFLLGFVLIELAVILLIVTQSAASTVTREKEDGTLDLLLSTPITSRYYIWGKLRGLVSFVIPLIAVPLASLLLFVLHDLYRYWRDPAGTATWIVFPEALLVLPPTLIIVAAFAAIVGMQMSLRCRTTVMAVMSSVGIVGAACFGLGACGVSALGNREFGQLGVVVGTFSPFTLAAVLIYPDEFARHAFGTGSGAGASHVLLVISGWVVAGIYAAIVWGMYKSMVKNFDMTIRKQST